MRVLVRTLILLGAAGMVIAVLYVPVRLSSMSQMFSRREAVRQQQLRNLPPGLRERFTQNRDRVPPLPVRFRIVATQFIAITITAWIGRRVFRLRLKR
ncbi:MAG TPA: hypothetical protein VKY31_15720 [Terriglobia bacterium]|nr:hypothetical protein [Terriglobia bacterium]